MSYTILCHYDEIALKGRNKGMFERALMNMIGIQAKKHAVSNTIETIKKGQGRILIELKDYTPEMEDSWKEAMQCVFGLAYIGIARVITADIEETKKVAVDILKDKTFESFRVMVKRSDKTFPINSPEVGKIIGSAIYKHHPKKVDLKKAEMTVWIELTGGQAYMYTNKIQCQGGLPVGTQGRVIILMSGGIDSPVSAYYAQKRGLTPIFLHFHSYPYTTDASIEKVKTLTKLAGKYAQHTPLYLAPLADAQKKIMLGSPERYRIILYRRLMMRVANTLARNIKAKAIITGEALGQVASQTLENMTTIEESSFLPILRPLIGFDKKEIIDKAKEIGTFETSILPHDDCCSLFNPKRPELRATVEEVKKIEQELPIDEMMKDILDRTEKWN